VIARLCSFGDFQLRKRSDLIVAYLPGILFSITIGMAATFISSAYGGPTVLFALLLGMAFNFISQESQLSPGVAFSSRSILRFGVATLGARITMEQILGLGWSTLVGVAVAVALTIFFGLFAARAIGLKTRFGVLTAGSVWLQCFPGNRGHCDDHQAPARCPAGPRSDHHFLISIWLCRCQLH
jgi:uncharacterized membrane protein YadS